MRHYTAESVCSARALTVCQPYSHLIALNQKPVENRSHHGFRWYRGVLLIHAGKSRAWLDDGDLQRYPEMPFGAIESIAWLDRTVPVERLPQSLQDHEHTSGPFCLVLEDVFRLHRPVPVNGAQGLWVPPVWVLPFIIEQLEARQ